MRFVHISDLHLGKKIYEHSMIMEQRNALNQVLDVIDERKPDGLFISGDIYDKPVPPVEALDIFDDFLRQLQSRQIKVFIISGNHDSAERIAFGADIFVSENIFISKPYDGNIQSVKMEDEYGVLKVHLIPFIKPAYVRRYIEDVDVQDYNSALKTVVNHMDINKEERNVVLVHQFITGAERSQSEESFLGGLDNVEYDVFNKFDYVALGHIHKPQPMGRQTVRYCGAPIKYALDEVNQTKSITLVEIRDKGNVNIETIPFRPIHDMRKISGTYMELTNRENYKNTRVDDYMHIVLTDEEDVPDALRKLRVIYPNILKLDYDNKRTRQNMSVATMAAVERKSPMEYINELYILQNNDGMSDRQRKIIEDMLEEI
ncbi:MAG: exonuclease SbcCD subunit D [Lachnospiraceae bacterium]|nr:exonuclease SbcCD subunit D [Lachnospiraceae bacterium]